MTATSYNSASEVTSVTLGSGDGDTYQYDPNTGRMTQYSLTTGGQSLVGALTWNANGSLAQQNTADPFYSGDTQNCSYLHDDLERVASVNCGSVWAQTFGYDAFGNITKSGSQSFLPTYSPTMNQNGRDQYGTGWHHSDEELGSGSGACMDFGRNTGPHESAAVISERAFAYTITLLLAVGWVGPLLYMKLYVEPAIRHLQWGSARRLSEGFYPALVVLFFLLMSGLALAYRSTTRSRGSSTPRPSILAQLRQMILGVAIGLLVFVISLFTHAPGDSLLARTVLVWPPVFPVFFVLLIVIGLPITVEIVFREVLMEFLLRNGGPVVAVMVVSFLFATVWPVFGFWLGLALGTLVSCLYYYTHSLIACIVANASASALIGAHLLWVAASSMR